MAPTIAATTYDCADAAALAGFYARLLDHPVDPEASEYVATVGRESGLTPPLFFLQVPDKTPGKNSVHLDLIATDLAAEVERAVALGARHIGDFDEHGFRWATLADPEGNLFDIAIHP
ncbi:VOC family protein [Nocardia carnea]|uniref:VOC family protein n=1 Tax=Nocardia carnea TaxID=37328 RepID=UPI0024561D9A|nr:VOC family protein [Nocardia carnea]